jgi:hypothetical protein
MTSINTSSATSSALPMSHFQGALAPEVRQ